jgi:hypothetical protein
MTLRRLRPDRNPMRRTPDRIQALLRAVLLALLVLGGPIATAYAGHAVYVSGLRTGRAQAAAWHRVPAVVLHAKPIVAVWRHPVGTGGDAALSVRWTTPQGSSRTGEITGRAGAAPGSVVTVWIDKAGRLTRPPLPPADVAAHVIAAMAVTALALTLLLCAVCRVASLVLDRYRLARWEADWLAVEPEWTKKR